jgi:hypothetical protein
MNSQIELTESVLLVNKLIDRTRERKLSWKERISIESNKSSEFYAQLDPSQEAVISQLEHNINILEFSLNEHDPRWSESPVAGSLCHLPDNTWLPNRTVLQVSIEKNPPYGYDTQEESDLSKLLVNLYELARRSAYQIDASVGKAINYLDKLAV